MTELMWSKPLLIEETLLRVIERLYGEPEHDKRWLAIARTHFEEGFMALRRATDPPERLSEETYAQLVSVVEMHEQRYMGVGDEGDK